MQNFTSLILASYATLLISCGGGGGGGDSSDGGTDGRPPQGDPATVDPNGDGDPSKNNPNISKAPSYPYPNIAIDPYFVGDQIEFDGKTFTVTSVEGEKLTFETQGRAGSYYEFEPNLSYNGTDFVPLAMGNLYGLGVTVYVVEDGFAEKDEWYFSLDGHWTENTPTSGVSRYFGSYESLDANGASNGIYPILMSVDFENIKNSSGADLTTGEEIYIYFTDIDGTTISGTISDQNSNQNTASFGLFGPNGHTIVGGYASPLGNGLFIGEQH